MVRDSGIGIRKTESERQRTCTRSKREKQTEIRKALRGIRAPKDSIVSTPEEFEWRQEVVGTIEYPAVKEGKVLYARVDKKT